MHATRRDHDRCLEICWHHRAEITEADHQILNIIASHWAADLEVTRAQLKTAREIINRILGR